MIIGLHGRARAGKDTVADALCRHHGYVKIAFATPIKEMLIGAGLCRRDDLDNSDKEKPLAHLGVSPRLLMQTLGTDWGRDMIRRDLWILRADQMFQQYWKFAREIVFTDVRFANEADYVRRLGGQIWHVLRALPANVTALHASDHGLPIVVGADSVIDNSAGLEQLGHEVKRALAGQCVVHGVPLHQGPRAARRLRMREVPGIPPGLRRL
jgi:hypothetical protein